MFRFFRKTPSIADVFVKAIKECPMDFDIRFREEFFDANGFGLQCSYYCGYSKHLTINRQEVKGLRRERVIKAVKRAHAIQVAVKTEEKFT